MKIALCLHGYFNNKADPSSGLNGFNYIKKILLDKYDIDIFIHSWDFEKFQEINNLYCPKKINLEKPYIFNPFWENYENYFNQNFERNNSIYKDAKLCNTFGFFCSRFKSINLCYEYSICNKINYDWVIISRFDLGQRDKYGNWQYYVSRMNFNPNLDNSYVYSAMWNQLNAGYADQWFYGSFENMKKLGNFYINALESFIPNSEYEKYVTTGWPDSVEYNYNSFDDPKQFTNECFKSKKNKSLNLMKYPRWQCINNHILYKWLMIKSGLYKKSRFTDTQRNILGFWEINND